MTESKPRTGCDNPNYFPRFSAIGIDFLDRSIRSFYMDRNSPLRQEVMETVRENDEDVPEPFTERDCVRALASYRRSLILACRGEEVDLLKVSKFLEAWSTKKVGQFAEIGAS